MVKQNLYEVLREILLERQRKDPDSSLRTFAKDLGISPSRLSLLLNNKIDLTRELLEKIYHGNKLDGDEKIVLQDCFEHYYLKSQVQVTREPSEEELIYLSGWEKDAFLKYLDAQVGPTDLKSLASYFSLTEDKVSKIIQVLISLGLVTQNPNGNYEAVDHIKLSPFVPHLSRLQDSFLELSHKAGKSLSHCPEELRSLSQHTFSVPVEQIPKIKKIIAKCVSEIEECIVHHKKGDIFHFSVQLFPLNVKSEDSDHK